MTLVTRYRLGLSRAWSAIVATPSTSQRPAATPGASVPVFTRLVTLRVDCGEDGWLAISVDPLTRQCTWGFTSATGTHEHGAGMAWVGDRLRSLGVGQGAAGFYGAVAQLGLRLDAMEIELRMLLARPEI